MIPTLAAFALLPALSAAQDTPAEYVLELLATDAGGQSSVEAMNAAGSACGYHRALGAATRPAAWIGGERIDIPLFPGASFGIARDINDENTVVGEQYISVGPASFSSRAFVWKAGVLSITTPVGVSSRAAGVNNSGLVVGTTSLGPVIWRNVHSPFALPSSSSGGCRAVNSAGMVIGTDAAPGAGFGAGVLWPSPTSRVTLPPLPGDLIAVRRDISDLGLIVGYSEPMVGGIAPRAVQWIDQEPTMLTLPPGHNRSVAHAVNDAGQIVGGSAVQSMYDPVIWTDGVPTFLNDLAPNQANIKYLVLSDVNNRGQLSGDLILDTDRRAFLLTPVARDSRH